MGLWLSVAAMCSKVLSWWPNGLFSISVVFSLHSQTPSTSPWWLASPVWLLSQSVISAAFFWKSFWFFSAVWTGSSRFFNILFKLFKSPTLQAVYRAFLTRLNFTSVKELRICYARQYFKNAKVFLNSLIFLDIHQCRLTFFVDVVAICTRASFVLSFPSPWFSSRVKWLQKVNRINDFLLKAKN